MPFVSWHPRGACWPILGERKQRMSSAPQSNDPLCRLSTEARGHVHSKSEVRSPRADARTHTDTPRPLRAPIRIRSRGSCGSWSCVCPIPTIAPTPHSPGYGNRCGGARAPRPLRAVMRERSRGSCGLWSRVSATAATRELPLRRAFGPAPLARAPTCGRAAARPLSGDSDAEDKRCMVEGMRWAKASGLRSGPGWRRRPSTARESPTQATVTSERERSAMTAVEPERVKSVACRAMCASTACRMRHGLCCTRSQDPGVAESVHACN
jgi:hypothetical protein